MFFNYSNHSEAYLCSNTTERFDDFFQLFKLQDDLIFFFYLAVSSTSTTDIVLVNTVNSHVMNSLINGQFYSLTHFQFPFLSLSQTLYLHIPIVRH